MQSDVMVKMSSQCAGSSSSTTKPTADTHVKTEPCPVDLAVHHGATHFVSELQHIKQEPGLSETDYTHTGKRNVQPVSTDSRGPTKTEPDSVPVNLSFGLKAESETHDVLNGEVCSPFKEEEDDVTRVKLETAEEERSSDLRQDEEEGKVNTTTKLLYH